MGLCCCCCCNKGLRIISARYRMRDDPSKFIDVTMKVRELVHDNIATFTGAHHIQIAGQDPFPNCYKELVVHYLYNGRRSEIVLLDGYGGSIPQQSDVQPAA
jgi:hypothetical protein